MTRLKRPDGNRGGRREAVDLGRRIDYISVASSTDRPLWPPRYAQADEFGCFLIDPREAVAAVAPSARTFASHKMKDATELAVRVSSAGFEFDCGRRRYLL